MPTHYETLGVPPDANIDDIKKAFRKLSKETHPDVVGGDVCKESALARFKEISNAAGVLSNPMERSKYDRELVVNAKMSPFGPAPPRSHHSSNFWTHKAMRPQSMIAGPILFISAATALSFILSPTQNEADQDTVQAWKNPSTGRYESPAPWDPLYRRLQPELEQVPRDQVHWRKR